MANGKIIEVPQRFCVSQSGPFFLHREYPKGKKRIVVTVASTGACVVKCSDATAAREAARRLVETPGTDWETKDKNKHFLESAREKLWQIILECGDESYIEHAKRRREKEITPEKPPEAPVKKRRWL